MSLPADIYFYIVASIAVILVGLAKGGFAGLGAAAMPILALVMDPVAGAGMLLPILMVQDIVSVWAFRRNFDRRTLLLTLPGAVVGIFFGWFLATAINADAVRGFVGVIALSFGVYRLLPLFGAQLKLAGPAPEWVGVVMGGVSGFTSQIAHAGGPPFQIWALSRNFPHLVFVGTSSIFFAIINWMKVPAYAALGQFNTQNMTLTAIFLPLAILSTMAGVRLVKRVSPERFNIIIQLLMVVVGAELIRQAIW
ncbi:sulfite exporter TauE/SafE family protein [Sphingorhabdus sp.]|uniref:sulfite exporter TauE/SafE family protein n=1 Tax=Sphingorhabdus sp. TaxID=1902408 RepID=UPI0037C5A6C8